MVWTDVMRNVFTVCIMVCLMVVTCNLQSSNVSEHLTLYWLDEETRRMYRRSWQPVFILTLPNTSTIRFVADEWKHEKSCTLSQILRIKSCSYLITIRNINIRYKIYWFILQELIKPVCFIHFATVKILTSFSPVWLIGGVG